MRSLLLVLLAAVLVLPGPAHAGWFSPDPVEATIPLLRVGDRMLFTTVTTLEDKETGTSERDEERLTIHVEAQDTIADRFGIPRAVDTFAIQVVRGDDPPAVSRCHRLAGGHMAVRLDPSNDAWSEGGGVRDSDVLGLRGRERVTFEGSLVATYDLTCSDLLGLTGLQGRTLREGDRIPLADVIPDDGPWPKGSVSEPAIAGTSQGRPSLTLSFSAGDAPGAPSLDVVLADGIPAVQSLTSRRANEHAAWSYVLELNAIERGEGASLLQDQGATLPEENPRATFVAPARRAFDDGPFALPFPYEEAYRALVTEPGGSYSPWLEQHPDAYLLYASFQVGTASDAPLAPRTVGMWWLLFQDGDAAFSAFVDLQDGVDTPLGSATTPARVPRVMSAGPMDASGDSNQGPPARIATSRSLQSLTEGVGIVTAEIAGLAYHVQGWGEGSRGMLTVSTTRHGASSSALGRIAHLDATSGGLLLVAETEYTYEREGGLLTPPSGSASMESGREHVSTLSLLAGPGVGVDLAVGGAAATGLALLVVLLKFLAIPLFTRLRRDRILDNPVRARIYERVRAEPGIHLAALTDVSGIGNGATRHHVDQLARHGFIIETKLAGHVRFYAAGEVPPEVARREMTLRAGAAREVYDLLAAQPQLSLREVGARIGISAPSVHRHKRRLEKAGLLPAAATVEVRAADVR